MPLIDPPPGYVYGPPTFQEYQGIQAGYYPDLWAPQPPAAGGLGALGGMLGGFLGPLGGLLGAAAPALGSMFGPGGAFGGSAPDVNVWPTYVPTAAAGYFSAPKGSKVRPTPQTRLGMTAVAAAAPLLRQQALAESVPIQLETQRAQLEALKEFQREAARMGYRLRNNVNLERFAQGRLRLIRVKKPGRLRRLRARLGITNGNGNGNGGG